MFESFGIDMSLPAHTDNKGKCILILESGPMQGLGEHSLTAEKCIQLNLLIIEKNVVWVCILIGQIVICEWYRNFQI